MTVISPGTDQPHDVYTLLWHLQLLTEPIFRHTTSQSPGLHPSAQSSMAPSNTAPRVPPRILQVPASFTLMFSIVLMRCSARDAEFAAVLVGEAKFVVHEELLTYYSSFLRAALNGERRGRNENHVLESSGYRDVRALRLLAVSSALSKRARCSRPLRGMG